MRETMKATSSSSSFAVYITLCITAVVHISYGDSRETCQPCPVTTTPSIDHVLPLERKAANHIDLICPASEKCGKVFLHGFMFNVTCNDGYTFGKFDGSPVFTLSVNGTWTPTVPECKRMCKPLKNVRCRYKGEEINCSNSVPVGTEATCRTGQLPGPSVVCKENRQWSYDLLDCPTPGMCKPLKNVRCRYKGEEINCSNSVPVGTEATCRTGHMTGPSVVCKENGQWNYDLVDCPTSGMCKPLKNVRCRYKGEEINCSNSVPVGTEATCRTGHMTGPSVVCKENGQWNYDLVDCPTSGMCKPLKNVRCRYKGEEINCSNSVPVGTEATCRTAHMTGPSVVCKENGQWNYDLVDCPTSGMCKPLKNVRCRYKGEEINCSNSVPVGTEATSRTGHMTGPSVVCKENGQWNYDLVDCPTSGRCKPLKNVRCRYKGEEINCSNSVPVGTEATCRTGHMAGPSVVCKENGQWNYDLVDCPTSGRCKPLKNVRCRYKGEEINCSNSVPVGTEATCRTGHMTGPSVVCKENGQWNYDLVDCPTSACGRKHSSESISPWIFAILIGDPPNLRCIGTLISRHIVLTSASCVCLNSERSVRSPETLKLIAGNQWLNKKKHGATVRVRHISVHPLYFGSDTYFAANVALIDLESSVPFTPACVDWDLEFDIAQRESASITTIDDSTLQEVVVQCESYVKCVSAFKKESRHYLTHDKFCLKTSSAPKVDCV